MYNALVLFINNNNPHYPDFTINYDALDSLPNGVPPDIMTVETDDDMI